MNSAIIENTIILLLSQDEFELCGNKADLENIVVRLFALRNPEVELDNLFMLGCSLDHVGCKEKVLVVGLVNPTIDDVIVVQYVSFDDEEAISEFVDTTGTADFSKDKAKAKFLAFLDAMQSLVSRSTERTMNATSASAGGVKQLEQTIKIFRCYTSLDDLLHDANTVQDADVYLYKHSYYTYTHDEFSEWGSRVSDNRRAFIAEHGDLLGTCKAIKEALG